jgi:hypothetical protein
MNKIGETSAGTIIVEMSKEEYEALAMSEQQNDEPLVLSEELVESFWEYIVALPMPRRVANSLIRHFRGNWRGLGGWNAFMVNHRCVTPQEWGKAVATTKLKDHDLMNVGNFGKESLRLLKHAINHRVFAK